VIHPPTAYTKKHAYKTWRKRGIEYLSAQLNLAETENIVSKNTLRISVQVQLLIDIFTRVGYEYQYVLICEQRLITYAKRLLHCIVHVYVRYTRRIYSIRWANVYPMYIIGLAADVYRYTNRIVITIFYI